MRRQPIQIQFQFHYYNIPTNRNDMTSQRMFLFIYLTISLFRLLNYFYFFYFFTLSDGKTRLIIHNTLYASSHFIFVTTIDSDRVYVYYQQAHITRRASADG